jgi:ABC-type histidine transport system ATPase subunit
MDFGQVIEEGPPGVIFTNPNHDRLKLFLSKILQH